MSGLTGLVQPIAVTRDGSHLSTIQAAALASFDAYMLCPDMPAWDEWLAGPFGKSVRRGSAADFRRLERWLDEQETPVCRSAVHVGEATAYGFVPMSYVDYPKVLANMQVAGTDFERRGVVPGRSEDPGIHVMVDEALTTGKAAAQAAHALWLAVLAVPDAQEAFKGADVPLSLSLLSKADLLEVAREPGVQPVNDAGLTEVEPGSLTACSWIV